MTMKEIEENGYNLNITRYISTQQAEEAIDLQAVNAELVELTQASRRRGRSNAFLKRAGLALLVTVGAFPRGGDFCGSKKENREAKCSTVPNYQTMF
ncbi:hypothetical protein MASR1M66_24250 [Aminivibrio sp.]